MLGFEISRFRAVFQHPPSTGTGTLTYTGAGHTTNRVINLAGTSGGATFNQSGTGLLKFTSDFTATGNGGKTLTLQGSTAGTGEIAGAIVNNGTVSTKTTAASFLSAATTITLSDVAGITTGSRITGTGLATNTLITAINTGTGAVTISPAATGAGTSGQSVTVTAITTLTKAGTGTWTLSGANTYTGITSMNAGVLRLGGSVAVPGGIATAGGTGALSFNGGALGLGSGDFTRNYGGITAGTIGRFDVVGNTGPWWVAYGADRTVNVGGAGASLTTYNGKPFNFGAADSTNMVTYVNGVNMTTATRDVRVYRGSTVGGIDARFSGALTTSGANMAGWLVSGGGTIAFTGANTFAGRINVFAGTVVVNSLTTTGSSSPIGNGTSGIGLAGGTFQYAPVAGSFGAGHSTNHNFTITASSSIDASGTGALVFNAPTGNIISPDVTGLTFTATGANKQLTALSTTSNLAIGMAVTGTGIASNSTIASIDSPTAVTLTSTGNVTAGTGVAATFGTPTARTLTLTGSNTDANTIAGILQDSSSISAGVLSLSKTGAGSWTLSGANTYTGATTVSVGKLLINGNQPTATGAVNINGTSTFGGAGTVGGTVTVAAAAFLTPGSAAATAGTLSVGGGLDISAQVGGTGKLSYDLAALASPNDKIAVTGTLTIGTGVLGFGDFVFTNLGGLQAGTYKLITSGGISGTLDGGNLTGTIGTFNGALQITGNDLELVVTSPSGYTSWQTANSTAQTINLDHDSDGVSNGVEYFLGGTSNTTGFTPLPGVVNTLGTLSVTWTKSGTYPVTAAYGTDFVVETSSTLTGAWGTASLGAGPNEVVISGNNVTYTFPSPGAVNFARLKVTGP